METTKPVCCQDKQQQHDLNASQDSHLSELISQTTTRLSSKYRRGAAEHEGCLRDLTAATLIEDAIDEAVDQMAYLLTLREKLASPVLGTVAAMLNRVDDAAAEATKAHGPLTDDHFRAHAILSEEVGEVARALLEQRRSGLGPSLVMIKTESAVRELLQVAATAVLMAINLEKGREQS